MDKVTKIKTGIFSGSFNPIHIGHLAIANYLCEYEGLDEIWFLVSPQNPLKAHSELWSDELRLKLVELAVEDYPRFHASDFEFHLPRPSYSVHTLDKLHATYPEREFYFIIGADNWARFDRWYQSERIIKENQLLIYPRPGYPIEKRELPKTVRGKMSVTSFIQEFGITWLSIHKMNYGSHKIAYSTALSITPFFIN